MAIKLRAIAQVVAFLGVAIVLIAASIAFAVRQTQRFFEEREQRSTVMILKEKGSPNLERWASTGGTWAGPGH